MPPKQLRNVSFKFFLAVLVFELRALCLQSRHSTFGAILPTVSFIDYDFTYKCLLIGFLKSSGDIESRVSVAISVTR
jgi:hypothetical protein